MNSMLNYPIYVTMDTNIFDAAKYDFSKSSTLSLLIKYVQNGKIKLVLSEIVIKEAQKHIGEQVKKICGISRRLRSEALKESTEHLINYVGLSRLLEQNTDKSTLTLKAVEMFNNFLEQTNTEILKTDLINLDEIIDDYFEIRPPFEAGEKKNEKNFLMLSLQTKLENDLEKIKWLLL